MSIQTECLSFKNHWTMSSSNDISVHLQCSGRWRFSHTAFEWFDVISVMSLALPGRSPASLALPRYVVAAPRHVVSAARLVIGTPRHVIGTPKCSQTYHNHSHVTGVVFNRDGRYSEGRPECPSMAWHSPDIDAITFSHQILSDTAGGSEWLNHILLLSFRACR